MFPFPLRAPVRSDSASVSQASSTILIRSKNREKLDEKYVLGAQDLMKLAHEHLKLQKKARDEAEAGF